MNQDTAYTAGEAAKLIGSNSDDVARLGQIITPDAPANGRGYKSLYSFRNLVELRLGQQLGHFGVSWKRIAKYIDSLRKSRGKWLEEDGLDGWLVLDEFWRWGAGTTLETATASLNKIPVTAMVAINVGAIKRGIKRAQTPISDQEFSLAISRIEQGAKEFKENQK